mmetsp:Transcript_2450/g.4339  ORF Transcript_2450/g.4339 Transcript_2450/m.4339 type:complete len:386 (+) Transcript_2450:61-1218(+)|eukprot:CAMPEP_0201649128 /NCGR_PEP_ID=MMETSP0493-20130528/38824_1 /ASSEMBLY_ACC=CAM_ASM_000838 /TAXON_ID=420259 /ORGANISM="Thalassiosira gravida, Strain GMp14c1" /LENGTH=385 /DNA_ID=CAMNT_0048124929 /DNA_START=37 /DNA_END=1194 /DNA_ORIENTATION=+
MVKPAIQRKRISSSALDQLISLYGFSIAAGGSSTVPTKRILSSVTPLAGGFSGTNYRIDFSDGAKFCLKICHGYDRPFVESQARVQDHLRQSGFERACFAIPLLVNNDGSSGRDNGDDDDEFRFAAIDPDTGDPCLALTFLDGRAADAVIESGAVPESIIFEQFGRALAEMHAVRLGDDSRLRHFRTGGACDVQQHVDRTLYNKMKASKHTRSHPYFTEFYPARLAALVEGMSKSGYLPQGVLHGDPFLDNALVDPETGQFCGFVDFEDATTGPLLFDVACAVIGTCFPEGSSGFNMSRFHNLMGGYFGVRPLLRSECQLFIQFCQLTLLCNCTWRFINFNVDNREVVECRDRYRELQDRIVALEENKTTIAIEKVLDDLAKAKN